MMNLKKAEEGHQEASRLLTKSVYDSARSSFMENNFVNLKNMFYTKAQFIIVLTCSSKFS